MAKCKSCNAPITWGKTPEGKNIPLQKVTAYEVNFLPRESQEDRPENQAFKIERDVYISHFLTCPDANKYSASKPKTEQGSFP